jgi:hypothetical protein
MLIRLKYMVMSRDQNAGQSHNINNDDSSFEKVKEFKHLGTTVTYRNSIQVKINSRWAGHVACMGEERGMYKVLVGKPKRKRPFR